MASTDAKLLVTKKNLLKIFNMIDTVIYKYLSKKQEKSQFKISNSFSVNLVLIIKIGKT
jgi:hypothetical protein